MKLKNHLPDWAMPWLADITLTLQIGAAVLLAFLLRAVLHWLIRRIVSPSSSATLSWRIRPVAIAGADNGMVSVTTSSSSAELAIRSTAGPESTACVT